MPATEFTLEKSDESKIWLTFFSEIEPPKAAIIIAGAMGAEQSYYAKIAQWLAEQGYVVMTFDYSGTGRSGGDKIRQSKADIFTWATDCEAVLAQAKNQYPALPLYWLGNSVGGQILGLLTNSELIDKVITVSSGIGYWRENTPGIQKKSLLLWYVMVPLSMPLAGYFPGKKLQVVGDLPKRVMRQWRRWCLNPEYSVGAEGDWLRERYAAFKAPMTVFSFTDDEMLSQAAINTLHSFFKSAPQQHHVIAPEDIGERRIGHLGFFREKFKATLWQQYLLPALENET